ncbi:MAG TPA: alpha/beta hydrolase [Rhizomicrobium sp.]|jgi:monoterpene epsilon-lactone hydrolase|nr:alpha/beta hydrolase [Rhizomicrobium sp.]
MSIQLFVADKALRVLMKRRFRNKPEIMELRAIMAGFARRPAGVPAGVAISHIELGDVPTELLRSEDANDRAALLYIHGGGFVGGTPVNHRALTGRLADQIGIPVYAVDYRLAPEHPFPAGLDDAVAAYRGLLDKGIAPGAIVVGGDSAGGNLTLTMALKLKALGLPMPATLVCLSPVTNLVEAPPSHTVNAQSDAMFEGRMFDTVLAAYCPNDNPSNPFISPLYGDVAGLPPTLIQCSEIEMLRDDSVMMADRLRAAGVTVVLETWPRVFHVWQVVPQFLPEARRAIERIVAFVNLHLKA